MAKKKKASRLVILVNVLIMVMLSIFAVASTYIGYKQFTDVFTKQYTETAINIAKVARNMVNSDMFDTYIATGGTTGEYKTIFNRIDGLCNSSGVTFIYVIRVDQSDYNHIEFVISTVNRNSNSDPFPIGYVRQTTNDEYRKKYKSIYEEGASEAIVIRKYNLIAGRDPHITALVPITDSKNNVTALMAVERTMIYLNKTQNTYLCHIFLSVAILIIISNIVYRYIINKHLVTPVLKIAEETVRFANENTKSKVPLASTIKTDNELQDLALSVDTMEQQTIEYFNNLTAITAEKERIGAELDIAATIQAGTLPHEFPAFPDRKEFDIYAHMIPAKEVGGDLYDYFFIDDDHLAIVIGDVSGKGISAALFMMAAKSTIKHRATLDKGKPSEILAYANAQLCENNEADMFVTVWLGILEISTGKIIAANGGHENPAIRKPDGNYKLITDKHNFVLGGMPGVKYKDYEYQIEKGGSLFIYTDGVAEATSAENELYGTDRMLEALNQEPNADTEKMLSNVMRSINAFVKDAPQFDDITMVSLKYFG